MRFLVTAISYDADGNIMHGTATDEQGRRTEEIDTRENVLFAQCTGRWDVEDMYETFWNRLNDGWENAFPAGKARVKVVKVEPLDDAARTGRSGLSLGPRLTTRQEIVRHHTNRRQE